MLTKAEILARVTAVREIVRHLKPPVASPGTLRQWTQACEGMLAGLEKLPQGRLSVEAGKEYGRRLGELILTIKLQPGLATLDDGAKAAVAAHLRRLKDFKENEKEYRNWFRELFGEQMDRFHQ